MINVQETLRTIGITRCYKGFSHAAHSIELAVSEEQRLEAVTKEIYMETAEYFGCNWTAVERNIRTVVARAWEVNPEFLIKMAGYPLDSAPTPSQFIEIIANYVARTSKKTTGKD